VNETSARQSSIRSWVSKEEAEIEQWGWKEKFWSNDAMKRLTSRHIENLFRRMTREREIANKGETILSRLNE